MVTEARSGIVAREWAKGSITEKRIKTKKINNDLARSLVTGHETRAIFKNNF